MYVKNKGKRTLDDPKLLNYWVKGIEVENIKINNTGDISKTYNKINNTKK